MIRCGSNAATKRNYFEIESISKILIARAFSMVCCSPWHSKYCKYLMGTFENDDAWAQIDARLRDHGCTTIVIRCVVHFICFFILSCFCARAPYAQIKSFFYLKWSESGWRLHARTVPQNEWGKVINGHWLDGLLFFVLDILFRFWGDFFYLTPQRK